MTTFIDREHAIEAHQAVLDFLEFQNHLHELEEAGLAVASRLGLDDTDSRRFARALVERFITDPKNGGGFAQWLADMPASSLSPVPTRGAPTQAALKAEPPGQSWVEFVISQIFLLFSAAKLQPSEGTPPPDTLADDSIKQAEPAALGAAPAN